MSMLGEQVKELRETADKLDRTHDVSSPWVHAKLTPMIREAADTIEGLRNRLQADALGSGTCDDLGGTGGYTCSQFACSKCGCTIEITDYQFNEPTMYTADGIADVPHFCPGCGARIRKAVSA